MKTKYLTLILLLTCGCAHNYYMNGCFEYELMDTQNTNEWIRLSDGKLCGAIWDSGEQTIGAVNGPDFVPHVFATRGLAERYMNLWCKP
jgi:hypothetical protein